METDRCRVRVYDRRTHFCSLCEFLFVFVSLRCVHGNQLTGVRGHLPGEMQIFGYHDDQVTVSHVTAF